MIRSTALFLATALTVAIAAEAAQAGTRELSDAVLRVIGWDEQSPNRDERLRFARAIEAYWVDFEQRVPRLSPRERDWLEAELDNTPGARLTKALNSPEYGLYWVRRRSELCLTTVRKAINAITNPELHETEMFYWLKMVNCYDGSNDTYRYLRQAGVPATNDFSYEGTDKVYAQWTNIEEDIIVNKVAAAAMAETMGWTLSDN